MKYKWLVLVLAGYLLGGCAVFSGKTKEKKLFDPVYIKSNIEFLASDELEGRDTGSRGEKLASMFIASEFEKYGVEPFGDDGSYFQNIGMEFRSFDQQTKLILLDKEGQELKAFQFGDEFLGYTSSQTTLDTVTELVFAGYGISAEEYNYDDYRNVDVAGKIALVLSGEPESEDSTFFAGKQRTKYSWSRAKREAAKNNGAVALIVISSDEFPWERVQAYVNRPSIELPNAEEDSGKEKQILGLILHKEAAKAAFENTTLSLDSILAIAAGRQPMPVISLNKKIQIKTELKPAEIKNTRNVVGIVPGTDPQLKNEFVTIGAHYDHVGTAGDSIYNGADDNASGTVGVMSVARAFAENHKNRRSVVFILYTGEEKGLLGSRYFAENFEGIKNTVVNINLDMIGRESADSLFSVGSDKMSSELHKITEEVNGQTVDFVFDYKYNDPNDPRRIYYRSDHVNFVKKGVPSVFFFDDHDEDYHKPGDDAHKINSYKISKVARLTYGISQKIANLDRRLTLDVKQEQN